MKLNTGTLAIIVLAIAMLILGMVLVKNIFNEPEFKITEEKYWEEEIIVNVSTNNNTIEFIIYGTGDKSGKVIIENPINCINKSSCIGIEEVYEDVEVEEMRFNKTKINKTLFDKCSINLNKDNLTMFIEFGNSPEIDRVTINNQIIESQACGQVSPFYKIEEVISKEELTTDWLNENCLCQDCHGTWDTMYNDYVTCDIRCSEYTCGDYKVEVRE